MLPSYEADIEEHHSVLSQQERARAQQQHDDFLSCLRNPSRRFLVSALAFTTTFLIVAIIAVVVLIAILGAIMGVFGDKTQAGMLMLSSASSSSSSLSSSSSSSSSGLQNIQVTSMEFQLVIQTPNPWPGRVAVRNWIENTINDAEKIESLLWKFSKSSRSQFITKELQWKLAQPPLQALSTEIRYRRILWGKNAGTNDLSLKTESVFPSDVCGLPVIASTIYEEMSTPKTEINYYWMNGSTTPLSNWQKSVKIENLFTLPNGTQIVPNFTRVHDTLKYFPAATPVFGKGVSSSGDLQLTRDDCTYVLCYKGHLNRVKVNMVVMMKYPNCVDVWDDLAIPSSIDLELKFNKRRHLKNSALTLNLKLMDLLARNITAQVF